MTDERIDQHREQLVEFTGGLVATPSPSLPGDERAVVKAILAHMQKLGVDGAQVAAKQPNRPNVICRLKGKPSGPTLMLGGHSDTRPVRDRSPWRTDPLDPVIGNGEMYGLGATDMRTAAAATICGSAALRHSQTRLAGDVLLVVNAGEERAMTCGSEYLSTDYGLKADVAVLGEPSGIDGPESEFLHLLSRGISCLEINVCGARMHSSLSGRIASVNACMVLAQARDRMGSELRLTFDPHPSCAPPTVNRGVHIEGRAGGTTVSKFLTESTQKGRSCNANSEASSLDDPWPDGDRL